MFRTLPSDCNLHVFSFLSSSDVINTKAISKNIKNFAAHTLLWKNFLKNEFCLPDWNKINDPEQKHKALIEAHRLEKEKFITYLTAQLYSLEIKKQRMEGKIEQPVIYFGANSEIRQTIYEEEHTYRIIGMEEALIHSYEGFLANFREIKAIYPDIDEKKIRERVCKLDFNDLYPYYEAAVKVNMPIGLRIILSQKKMHQDLLDKLLHMACKFLNLPAAMLLIEFGANVNALTKEEFEWGYTKTTCLLQVFEAFTRLREKRLMHSEKVVSFIEFLLKNAADPDAEIHYSDESDEDDDDNIKKSHFVTVVSKQEPWKKDTYLTTYLILLFLHRS